MVQHQNDSFTDNVTPSDQSATSNQEPAAIEKRAAARWSLNAKNRTITRNMLIIRAADRGPQKKESPVECGDLCPLPPVVFGDTIAPQWKFNQEMGHGE
ncbi:hypothetical protein ATANTOWER_002739 [Ataeniobius toweri]|uniref:Uncharacterized protein n=1 Tax=Ataeniobius toweri TaxID=208326 RepID=A0ABU7ADY3_9TELE|nr:hypothetical protein [Ataeniobius toweri]